MIKVQNIRKNATKGILAVTTVAVLSIAALATSASTASADTRTTDAKVSFEAGMLELKSAPELDFGKHSIPDIRMDYILATKADDLIVSDLRGGAQGYKVTVSLDQFENAGAPSLAGSEITFDLPTISPSNGTIGNAPTVPAPVIVASGGASVQIVNAAVGQGSGVWNLMWGAPEVKLTVFPGTAAEGANIAKLNWSLEDTP